MKSLTTFFIALVLANFIQSGLNSKTGNNSGKYNFLKFKRIRKRHSR